MTRMGDLRTECRRSHGPDVYRRGPTGIPICLTCHPLSTRVVNHGTPEERFWKRVDKDGPAHRPELGPCWLWVGATSHGGYPAFSVRVGAKQRTLRAHRFALQLELGRELLSHEYACHHCDNPPCVRGSHLFVGSAKSNIEDAVGKGRMALAGRNGRVRDPFRGMSAEPLTPGRVELVRIAIAEGIPGSRIAAFLGISESAVSRIRNGSRHARAA